MKRRPVIEHRRPDEAGVLRARKAKAAMQNRVSAALAPLLAEEGDRRTLGSIVISFGSRIVASATDGAGAQSALGVAARTAEGFEAVGDARLAAAAHFRGGRG